MTARTAEASTVPQPRGKPGGPGLFGIKGAQLPPYIQHVRDELMKKGTPESRATQLATGIVRNWAEGHDGHGHKVSADVQAAATKAIAAYDALRARAKATPNKSHDLSRRIDLADADIPAGSAMVALYPPGHVAKKIAVPEGLSPGDLHVTLAFLGKNLTPKQQTAAQQVVQSVAAQHAKMTGSIGGLGRFPDGGDGEPHFAPVDVPGLAEVRGRLVEQLQAAGVPVSTDHGFTPHMTLTYGDPAPEPVKPTSAEFPHLHLVVGGKKQRFPLAGKETSATKDMSRRPMLHTDLAVPFDPAKHPRGGKGTAAGGKFVPVGAARNQQAAKAQKAKGAQKEYKTAMTATGAQRLAQLKKMTPAQLAKLSRAAYSFKSSDPSVVKLRIAVANELARRGYDVKDFGALGGGINSDKKLPAAKAAGAVKKAVKVSGKRPSARKRRAAARSAKATSKTSSNGAPKPVSMSTTGAVQLDLSKLPAAQRNKLQASQFAIPERQAYPIPDKAHAIAALSRVAQHGTPAEKARVKAAIRKKFPQLAGGGSK